MQKLHLVGFTTDHRAVILSPRRGAKSGGFVLEVDEAVAEAVAAALDKVQAARVEEEAEQRAATAARPQSALPIREVQARLRAGHTVDEIAAEAGVEPEWVARFAAPVFAEQARIVDAAHAVHFTRARLGPSSLPLGDAVRRNLTERGSKLTPEQLRQAWSARQVPDGRWVVSLTYTARGREQSPAWIFDPKEGTLEAEDRLATSLGHVEGPPPAEAPARSRPPTTRSLFPVPAAQPAAPTPGRVAAARKAAEARLEEASRLASARDAEFVRRWPPARHDDDEGAVAPAPDAGRGDAPAPTKDTGAGDGAVGDVDQAAAAVAPGEDPFAAALAAIRQNIEQQISAFEERRSGRDADGADDAEVAGPAPATESRRGPAHERPPPAVATATAEAEPGPDVARAPAHAAPEEPPAPVPAPAPEATEPVEAPPVADDPPALPEDDREATAPEPPAAAEPSPPKPTPADPPDVPAPRATEPVDDDAPAPAPAPAPSPAGAPAETAEETAAAAARRRRGARVVRTPIDLSSLGIATGGPTFRGDVPTAAAASPEPAADGPTGNGASPSTPPRLPGDEPTPPAGAAGAAERAETDDPEAAPVDRLPPPPALPAPRRPPRTRQLRAR